jgi:hypothetical protein
MTSIRPSALAVGLCAMLAASVASAQTSATNAFTFSRTDYPSTAGARAIVSADFDNDGAPDFATANTGGNTVDVFLNRQFGGGGFIVQHYAVGAGPFDLAVGNFNFDSYPDLVVAAADADEIDVLMGTASGFQPAIHLSAPGNPRGVAVAYLGSGGYSIVYSSYTNGTISFINYDYDSQTFTPGQTLTAGKNPQGIAIGLFKTAGYGYPDIAVANTGGSPITLFINNDGNGNFTRSELKAPSGMGATHLSVLTAADFDKDGRTDLAAASTADSEVALFMNSSTGLKWTTRIKGSNVSSPRGITAADLNADGRPELIIANRASNSVTVFIANATQPVFTTHQVVTSGSGARAVTAADFDDDGRVDLVTGNEYASAGTVLWNRTAGGGGTGATAFRLQALPDATPDSWVMGGPYAIADFNRNGTPDVVVGDGVVLDGTTAVRVDAGRQLPWVLAAVAGDFNEDGNPDYAQTISYHVSDDPWVDGVAIDFMIGDGTGHFTLGTSIQVSSPRGIVSADFNRDGHADVVVLDQTSSGLFRKVFLGHGDGTFAESDQPTSENDYLVGMGDINGDGKTDLVVWNYAAQTVGAYLGSGTGTFPTEKTTSTAGGLYGAHVADLNGDGRSDVVATRSGMTLVAWLGLSDGSFSAPLVSDLPESAYGLVVADLTGDGHPDVLTAEGTLAVGRGDGTFSMNRTLNIGFTEAMAVDIDRNGLVDLYLGTYDYTAMALYNLNAEPANTPPVAKAWPHDMTMNFAGQFGEDEGFTLQANKSYDPDLDPLSYTWFENGQAIGNSSALYVILASGTHHLTLVVRDNAGGESQDTATVTITPYEEIVIHTGEMAGPHGAWTRSDDSTAADGMTDWHPNANGAKLAAPLANPANYIEVSFPADPTQDYKIWVRMKAQSNSPYNDSVFVQFDGAVDASGAPIYQSGTTDGLAVNLEECSGCGLAGWGWRDEAWGTRGAIGTATVRFPGGSNNQMWHTIRIQTREDGAMIDQVVLSSVKYKTKRPGAVKNDNTILIMTLPDE